MQNVQPYFRLNYVYPQEGVVCLLGPDVLLIAWVQHYAPLVNVS